MAEYAVLLLIVNYHTLIVFFSYFSILFAIKNEKDYQHSSGSLNRGSCAPATCKRLNLGQMFLTEAIALEHLVSTKLLKLALVRYRMIGFEKQEM